MKSKADYIVQFEHAIENGTFLRSKHHPSGISVRDDSYRTVTVQDPSGLQEFLRKDAFVLELYHNSRYMKSPEFLVLRPTDPTYVPGSGIPANACVPNHACDRFVAVSGLEQGWHIYAEQQSHIDAKVRSGQFVYLGEVT